MIYLASPYAHDDKLEMEYRFQQAATAVAHFMELGFVVYSPIVHNHYLACNFSLPRTWDFWKQFDLPILDRCDELWVLELDGWQKSNGVNAEIAHAINTDKLIIYVAPEGEYNGEDYKYRRVGPLSA